MFLLVGIFGCGKKLTEGEVISKVIEPESTYLYMMPIPHTQTVGKTTTTYFTYIPVYMYDDEDYRITIRGVVGKKGKYETEYEEVTETYYLYKGDFDKINVGDYFIAQNESTEPNEDVKVGDAN